MSPVRVAILTFDGFNEIDSFVPQGIINRCRAEGICAEITSPATQVTSMNGVTVTAQRPLEWANEAEIVLFGSGLYTRAIAESGAVLDRLGLDPLRQTIGAQCSGTLLLARLGLLGDMPACTDSITRPWLAEAGVRVIEAPFHARGPIATAGGCLASVYLATWVLARSLGAEAAVRALNLVAPVGEKDSFTAHALEVVGIAAPEPGIPHTT